MKRILVLIFGLIMNFTTYAMITAPIPMPQSGGDSFLEGMQQGTQIRMMQEQIAMMQEQRALMRQQAINQDQSYNSYSTNFVSKGIDKYLITDDYSKINLGLENNSIGQATSWRNSETGIGYTFVPIQNVIYQGNPYCRKYSVSINFGAKKQRYNNLACRQFDSVWLRVN